MRLEESLEWEDWDKSAERAGGNNGQQVVFEIKIPINPRMNVDFSKKDAPVGQGT